MEQRKMHQVIRAFIHVLSGVRFKWIFDEWGSSCVTYGDIPFRHHLHRPLRLHRVQIPRRHLHSRRVADYDRDVVSARDSALAVVSAKTGVVMGQRVV